MTVTPRRLSVGKKLILLGLLDLGLTIYMFTPRKAKKRRRARPIPDVHTFRTAKGEAAIMPYLAAAERVSEIPGLAQFGKALAWSKSRFDNKTIDTKIAAEACALFLERHDEVFSQNPYAEAQWCWGAGGWYGFLPADVMALPPFQHLDPKLVFDPSASTAMLAALVQLIIEAHLPSLPPDQRTWLAVRRGLENLDALFEPDESTIRKLFATELASAGIPEDFARQTPIPQAPYPGTTAVWQALKNLPAE